MFALSHTLKAFIALSEHILDTKIEKDFEYIVLGKLQSDLIEKIFSQYRTMAGCKYNVSIQNLLEGEKKLKLMSVLKMNSCSNQDFDVKDYAKALSVFMSFAMVQSIP